MTLECLLGVRASSRAVHGVPNVPSLKRLKGGNLFIHAFIHPCSQYYGAPVVGPAPSYSKFQEPGQRASKVMNKRIAEKEEGDFLDSVVWEAGWEA